MYCIIMPAATDQNHLYTNAVGDIFDSTLISVSLTNSTISDIDHCNHCSDLQCRDFYIVFLLVVF